jgi:hypothetical protein
MYVTSCTDPCNMGTAEKRLMLREAGKIKEGDSSWKLSVRPTGTTRGCKTQACMKSALTPCTRMEHGLTRVWSGGRGAKAPTILSAGLPIMYRASAMDTTRRSMGSSDMVADAGTISFSPYTVALT